MISTKKLSLLPEKKSLQLICKTISVLDAIFSPEWEYRYYSYNSKWSANEEFFEMKNGEGSQMLILFSEEGCVINGFDEERYNYEKDIPKKEKLTKGLLKIYDEFIFGEPVKSIGTTFCIWSDKFNNWKTGDLQDNFKDGSEELLYIFDGNPETYKNWASEYYEDESDIKGNEISIEILNKIYSGMILTKEIVLSLVNDVKDWDQLKSDLDEIDYPYDFL